MRRSFSEFEWDRLKNMIKHAQIMQQACHIPGQLIKRPTTLRKTCNKLALHAWPGCREQMFFIGTLNTFRVQERFSHQWTLQGKNHANLKIGAAIWNQQFLSQRTFLNFNAKKGCSMHTFNINRKYTKVKYAGIKTIQHNTILWFRDLCVGCYLERAG